jgi:hypothetical protein
MREVTETVYYNGDIGCKYPYIYIYRDIYIYRVPLDFAYLLT